MANIDDAVVERYARISDAALDAKWHYGLAAPGTFGYAANIGTAGAVLEAIVRGVRDTEKLAAIAHEGWGDVALVYEDPVYQEKPEKRTKRHALANTLYKDLSEDDKEKDRVPAMAILQAWLREHPEVR